MNRFSNQVALVAGAGSGIGEATAKQLAAEGATVILCARSADKLAAVAEAITAAGGKAVVKPLDVSDEARYTQVINEVVAEFGRLDVLINNAMAMTASMIAETSLADWRSNFTVSVDGVFIGTKLALQQMQKQQSGAIVNVSSVCSELAAMAVAGYSAAKSAVNMFTKSTAIEAAPYQIRCNAVMPGVVMTPPTAALLVDDAAVKATAASVPLKRIATPEEMSEVICFLASPQASYVTGVVIAADGGRTCELVTGAADFTE